MELVKRLAEEIIKDENLTLEEALAIALENQFPDVFNGISEKEKREAIRKTAVLFFAIASASGKIEEILENAIEETKKEKQESDE